MTDQHWNTANRYLIARGYDEQGREVLRIFSDDTVETFVSEDEPLGVVRLVRDGLIAHIEELEARSKELRGVD